MDIVKQHDDLVQDVQSMQTNILDEQRKVLSSSKVDLVESVDCSFISQRSSLTW